MNVTIPRYGLKNHMVLGLRESKWSHAKKSMLHDGIQMPDKI